MRSGSRHSQTSGKKRVQTNLQAQVSPNDSHQLLGTDIKRAASASGQDLHGLPMSFLKDARHLYRVLHERSFHMKFMKRAFGEFHKFHTK